MTTKLVTTNSVTTTNEPGAGSLLQGELAVNIPDSKLWVGDAAGDPSLVSEPAITTIITKTVGTGKDFVLFQDAMVWAMNQTVTGPGRIILTLDDGNHNLTDAFDLQDGLNYAHYVLQNTSIEIRSTSGIAANCTLAIGNGEPGGLFPLFFFASNSVLFITDVTIDPTAFGSVDSATIVQCDHGCDVVIDNCVFENTYAGVDVYGGSHVSIENGSVVNLCSYAALVSGGNSSVRFANSTISNSSVEAINVVEGSVILSTVTFTTNTADTNIPINEIQNNGSYITDGAGQLIIKNGIDDVPVDAATTIGISSNWAFDHENNATAHGTPVESIIVPCTDETTDLVVGTGIYTFRMPYAFTLSDARASVSTAATGANLTVDINETGVSIFSTVITLDDGEKTSTTATTPAVISDTALADDAEITIDVDVIGATIAGAGLKITLIGTRV